MSAQTAIEWTDATWSPWWGCTKVSVGDKGACEYCYAEKMANRFGVGWGPHAPRKLMSPAHWLEPARWNRKAEREGTRPFVFPSMCDPFDNAVDPEWRRWFFERMRTTPALVWLLLTKRPQNIQRMSEAAGGLPDNAAIGCTVVTQEEARRDIPHLLGAQTNMFRFVSIEPMLGPIDLGDMLKRGSAGLAAIDPMAAAMLHAADLERLAWVRPRIDWVICGGESGPHARPSHPDWFRALRDQCAAAGVPFLLKQWGQWWPSNYATGAIIAVANRIDRGADAMALWEIMSNASSAGRVVTANEHDPFGWAMMRVGKKLAGRLLDGREHNGFPAGFGKGERAAA